ncbi:MAG TPA: bacillithiol biosynthesis cysteine-adding enzyme BshC [Bryobacteraceae bacterium]|nr:bacillithiol biosynthesis cysteine-adding enzyme BshC [Bryobacteraceae bacterium]
MEPACLRHTELPHTSRLFSDFLYQYHRVERFYTAPPSTGYPEDRRPALIEALRLQNTNESALERLAHPGAVAVVTGQQVGLFGGPAYTIYKALTAARLAADLTAHGRPAVPVFWLATEDHDWPEVNHCHVYGGAHRPSRLDVSGTPGTAQPVGGVVPEGWPVDELRQLLQELPFGADVAAIVADAYAPGRSMGDAFRSLLESLLKPWGFLFLDPLQPAIRRLAAPMMREAVAIGPDLNQLLLARNRELENAGYHTQVHVDARTSLFFLFEKGRRVPLREVRYSSEELAARAQDLSPNALLRPVLQDFMLPTAAYIGGPAELAYFAQSQVLYERLLGHMPRVVSRNGFTLIDARSAKLLERYGLRLQDFFHGEHPLRERVAARLVPEGLDAQFDAATATVRTTLDGLRKSLASFDPTLESAMKKGQLKMMHQLTRMQEKTARAAMARDERAGADASYLYSTLYPQKHLQERYYSILPFLAQHGPDLLDRLYETVHMDCPDHVLMPL